ncbi:MAG: hypothetical protein JSU04_06145 [Bdellovibrionales bacterium]|nr:hypothetical protein [Bdellovibrionales bacterium]
MKNVLSYTLMAASLTFAACGSSNYGDSREAEIKQIRENAKQQLQTGPTPVPEKIVYVTKDKEVIKEQATLNDNYFKIDLGDKMMAFYEGQQTSYKITLRVQDSDIQMKLTAKGLPTGAEFRDISTAQSPNTYELRWTPATNTISYDEQPPKVYNATLVPVLVSAKTQEKANTVKGLSLEKTVFFSLFRNQEKPSQLTVTGLDKEVKEGDVVPFSITVKFPGVDANSAVKPSLSPSEDETTQVVGSDYMEMDGARYVSKDPSRPSLEYLGDYKWKFNRVFDTKNMPVENQKLKNGTVANVNFTQTRIALRVVSAFNASPSTVIRVKINRPTPEAPATPATPTTPPASEAKPQNVKTAGGKK